MDDETTLNMYKCEDVDSCSAATWTLLTSNLNTTTNIISTYLDSLSVFLVSEDKETETETVTETTTVTSSSGGGGGGSLVNVPKQVSLELIVAGALSMHMNDTLEVPIILMNTGELDINDITLDATTDSDFLTIEIEDTSFAGLASNESVSTNMLFTSSADEAQKAEITLTAIGQDPSVTETSKIIMDIIDENKANKSMVEEKMTFLADLFKNNPDCLELQEMLGEAKKAFSEDKFDKALVLIGSAISACREMLSYKDKEMVLETPKKFLRFRISLPLIITLILAVIAIMLFLFKTTGFKLHKRVKYKSKKTKGKVKKRKIGPTKGEEKEIKELFNRKI